MIGFSTKLHATAAAHNFAPPASPEKGITLCRKGTHQPLMPRQGGGSARSASSFVFNWDKMASSGSQLSGFFYVRLLCTCGGVVPLSIALVYIK